MKKCGIYLITNNINGKKYIGQSRNLVKRWNDHKDQARHNRSTLLIHNAMRDYRIDNFSFDILLECPIDMLDVWESDMIRLYDTFVPNGYNIRDGKKGITEEERLKLSERMKENNPMKNPEVADKVRNKLKGVHTNRVTEYQIEVTKKRMKENNPMKNPEVVKKVSMKMTGRKQDKERVIRNSKYTNILQFSKDGKFINKWDLVSDITKELGVDHCCIYAVLNGKQKTAGGYIWRCI